MDIKQDEIQQFLQNIQPIRVIEWNLIEIQKDLGKGIYGVVKIVKIPKYSTFFTMKILDIITSKFHYERITREIQLLQSCSHLNILHIYGRSINSEKEQFEIGIIIELKWSSLANLLDLLDKGRATKENFPPGIEFNNEIKQKIIFGISAGLFYLNTKKIIHRDRKPDNILLYDNINRLRKLIHINNTPLHYAAENNSKEIGEILIRKADINAKDIFYQISYQILIIVLIVF